MVATLDFHKMVGCLPILEKSTFGADQQLGCSLPELSFVTVMNQCFKNKIARIFYNLQMGLKAGVFEEILK